MNGFKRQMFGAVFAIALLGCSDYTSTAPGNGGGGGGTPPATAVLLRDIVTPHLPSPFYHFEYDADGVVSDISFASGFTDYRVINENGRISELDNHTPLATQDRLTYQYDDAGRVSQISYVHPDNEVFVRVSLTYDGDKLTGLQRERLTGGSFVVNKIVSFSYYPDGNLEQLVEHFPAVEGLQTEATLTQQFEGYDDKINVDGFALLHDEFFDHLVFLPGVQLQKGNAARTTQTGDGLNFREDRVYQYDEQDRPTSVSGDFVELNGENAGRHTATGSVYTYY